MKFEILKNIAKVVGLILFSALILAVSLRGKVGNPTSAELNTPYWKDEGPFELSPERGRFALTYSLLEDQSFQFSLDLARFAAPDVATAKNQFVSLFAPGISYLIMPGYVIGKMFGISQVGTYAVISFFAILNILFIRAISLKLGTSDAAATFGGLVFAFASPAFAYGVSLYQHHVSSFLILSCIYVLIRWKSLWSLLYIWFICALALMIDNPNLFFLFPIGVYALGRIINFETIKESVVVSLKPLGIFTFVTMILPLSLFMYTNFRSYGNPFQLAGTATDGELLIDQITNTTNDAANQVSDSLPDAENSLKVEEGAQEEYKRSALGFFKTRQLPNGMFTHILSADRGTLMYAPVMFLGIVGLFFIKREQQGMFQLLLSISLVVLLIYSMWGDPYGGWAFGSRYMIPAYAILGIGVALFTHHFRKNILVTLFILGVTGYSLYVNTIGALTTSRIPPKIQVLSLEEQTGIPQPYTYERGIQMLDDNSSKSFFYREVMRPNGISAWDFTYSIIAAVGGMLLILMMLAAEMPSRLFTFSRTLFSKRVATKKRASK